MRLSTFYTTLSVCLLLNSSCAPVSQKYYEKKGLQPLSTKQIQERIQGKKIHLESIDFDAFVQFHEDMKLTGTRQAGGNDSGTWTVSGADLLCLEFRSWYFGDSRCYRIIDDNSQLIFFTTNGALGYTGTLPQEKKVLEPTGSHETVTSSGENYHNQPAPPSTESDKDRFARLAKNCPGCNLSGVDLSYAQLSRANLAGADLSGADLSHANLRQANLSGADLSEARFISANLPGADLSSANLTSTNFNGSNLIRANISDAIITNTNFTGAHLERIQGKIQ